MIKTIIVDDEKNAIEVLEIQLRNFFSDRIKVIATFSDSRKAIEEIPNLNPDLIFLDIEMPFKNGFDVIQETRNGNYKVIFTTAYNQFAIRAFKVSALDYLLKPIDEFELRTAVEKMLQSNSTSEIQNQIRLFLEQTQYSNQTADKIGLHIADAVQFFEYNEILRFESDSNYTHIFLVNGKKITTAKTLKEVEDRLTATPFFRIHNSHIVNLNFVSKYIKGNAGYALMNDGTQISISRSRKDEFLDKFKSL